MWFRATSNCKQVRDVWFLGVWLCVWLYDLFPCEIHLAFIFGTGNLYQCNQGPVCMCVWVVRSQRPVSSGIQELGLFSLAGCCCRGSECVCVCVCVSVCVCVCVWDWSWSSSPVKVLNFTNDLTMPPGAGSAPGATLFVCLSVYLESGHTQYTCVVLFPRS